MRAVSAVGASVVGSVAERASPGPALVRRAPGRGWWRGAASLRSAVASALACGLLSSLASSAAAAPTITGFALNRHQPAEAGSDWFANESLDLRGGARPALAITADYSHRPLRLFDADGREVAAVVEGQFFYHLGASLVLGRRVRLAASAPLLVYSQGGQGVLAALGGAALVPLSSHDGSGLGDARFALDLRLLGAYDGAFTLAIGGRVHAPTGSERQFTSDGQPRFEGRLMWAGQPGIVAYAAYVGTMFHGEADDYAGVPFGTDVTFGAGLALRLADGRLRLGPEVYGRSVISDGGAGFARSASTPVELALGAKLQVAGTLRVGAAAGRGLTRGLGASALRVLGVLDWAPEPLVAAPPAATEQDRDGDGVADQRDACPAQPGPARSSGLAPRGCPEPRDRDRDGVHDEVDACADEPGLPSGYARLHGCPAPDRDNDGVADAIDACPDAAGVEARDTLRSGCPADADGDGVDDSRDACPSAHGRRSTDPAAHGCPLARLAEGEIVLRRPVQFMPGGVALEAGSHATLDAVADVLLAHPEVELCSVEVSSAELGAASADEKLSGDRALSLVMRLVSRGVGAQRLVARGLAASPEAVGPVGRVELRVVSRRAHGEEAH